MARLHQLGLFLFLSVGLLVTAGADAPKPLPGLQLGGSRWTYQDEQVSMSGVLFKPEGAGPFPAVLISHGKGGRAEGFGSNHARELVKWGLVCIAPSYTHAAGAPQPPAPGMEGANEENLRRARQCLTILESLSYVDKQRIGAYGHSMGGFVTIGLAALEPKRLKAAAITGSGISPRTGYPAPSGEQAAKIRTPFLILHGSQDNVVRPSQSAALKEVLEKNRVPLEYHLFEREGHPIDRTQGAEVYARMRGWFEKHGVLMPAR